MREIFKKDVAYLKRDHKDMEAYVRRLEMMLDKDIEFYDFIDTGIMVERGELERQEFLILFANVELHPKCTDIMRYIGGYYIQMLTNGYFLFKPDPNEDGIQSMDIEEVEDYMWKNFVLNSL